MTTNRCSYCKATLTSTWSWAPGICRTCQINQDRERWADTWSGHALAVQLAVDAGYLLSASLLGTHPAFTKTRY